MVFPDLRFLEWKGQSIMAGCAKFGTSEQVNVIMPQLDPT